MRRIFILGGVAAFLLAFGTSDVGAQPAAAPPPQPRALIPVTDLPNLATLTLRASCENGPHVLAWNDDRDAPTMRPVTDTEITRATFRVWKTPRFPLPLNRTTSLPEAEPIARQFRRLQSRGLRIHAGDMVQLSLLEAPANGQHQADLVDLREESSDTPAEKFWLSVRTLPGTPPGHRLGLGELPASPGAWQRPESTGDAHSRFFIRSPDGSFGEPEAFGIGSDVVLHSASTGRRIAVSRNCSITHVPSVQRFDDTTEVPLSLGSPYGVNGLPAFAIREDRWTDTDFFHGSFVLPAIELIFISDLVRVIQLPQLTGAAGFSGPWVRGVPPLLRSEPGWCLLDSGMPTGSQRIFSLPANPLGLGSYRSFSQQESVFYMNPPSITFGRHPSVTLPEDHGIRVPAMLLCGTEFHRAEPQAIAAPPRSQSTSLREEIRALRREIARLESVSDGQKATLIQLMQTMTQILSRGAQR